MTVLFLLPSAIVAHPGIGIVMNSAGHVFYTDLNHVWEISPNGTVSIAVKDVHTHQLYLDKQDNLYGEHVWYEGEHTDKWVHYRWKLTKEKELVRLTPDTEGFPVHSGLVRDCERNMYWQEKVDGHEVIKRQDESGKVFLHSDHKFEDVRWMFVPREKMELYVIDLVTLKKVEPDGQVRIISEDLSEKSISHAFVRDIHNLMGMWEDNASNLYIAVFGGKKVKKVSPDGEIKTVVKVSGRWSPSGGLFDQNENLWLLEYSLSNNARVKRIDLKGNEIIFQGSDS